MTATIIAYDSLMRVEVALVGLDFHVKDNQFPQGIMLAVAADKCEQTIRALHRKGIPCMSLEISKDLQQALDASMIDDLFGEIRDRSDSNVAVMEKTA